MDLVVVLGVALLAGTTLLIPSCSSDEPSVDSSAGKKDKDDSGVVTHAGTAVGYPEEDLGEMDLGKRAVLWGADGEPIDLNSLIDPATCWTLAEGDPISEEGAWVPGAGISDTDGTEPLAGFDQLWPTQDALVAEPEPASLSLLALGGLALIRRRP
jgi:MYXO-CTERM domain-containing protein